MSLYGLYGGVRLPGLPDLENVRVLDLLPDPMIMRMHRYGIAIDVEYLRAFGDELGREMNGLAREISSYVPAGALNRFADRAIWIEDEQGSIEVNPTSAIQIRDLLYNLLKLGRTRDLRKTGKGKLSTDRKQLQLLADDHPVVQLILDYRQRQKLKSAFADTLPALARLHGRGYCAICETTHECDTWRVHTEFLTTRAETGRLASRHPNLQQIPVRSDLGQRIRRAFMASPGARLISVDFSQIELRDLAHLANAASMIGLYKKGMDIHMYTACQCFSKDYEHYTALARAKENGRLTPEQKRDWNDFALRCRLPSKNVNFMIIYGATAKGLQAQLALSGLVWSDEECEDFIERWFELYPEVRDYIDIQHYRARRYEYVWDPFGRIRRVPEVRSSLGYIRDAGLRQAMNMPIQSCSAGQTKLVMGELEELFGDIEHFETPVIPLLSIHDQLIVETPEYHAEPVCELMKDVFADVMRDKWRVPIEADGEILTRWSKE